MKIGIDSYCYHRYFGEVYPQQQPAAGRMTLEDFLRRAHELQADGVSLESCYIPQDLGYLRGVRALLDQYGLERVWAWGHRDGLEGGGNRSAYEDMIRNLECARTIGARVMRVVGSSRKFRHEEHGPQLRRLAAMFREAVQAAEQAGVRLAIENHIDFGCSEMLWLIEETGSPWLGLNFDTGNCLRLLEDPVKALARLAPHVYAVHLKDVDVRQGVPADEWYFFSSVPVGEGLVDCEAVVRALGASGYAGLLAVEIDFLHPRCGADEDRAVAASLERLRKLVAHTAAQSATAAGDATSGKLK